MVYGSFSYTHAGIWRNLVRSRSLNAGAGCSVSRRAPCDVAEPLLHNVEWVLILASGHHPIRHLRDRCDASIADDRCGGDAEWWFPALICNSLALRLVGSRPLRIRSTARSHHWR